LEDALEKYMNLDLRPAGFAERIANDKGVPELCEKTFLSFRPIDFEAILKISTALTAEVKRNVILPMDAPEECRREQEILQREFESIEKMKILMKSAKDGNMPVLCRAVAKDVVGKEMRHVYP
jgi:hypothetical protein